MLGVKRRPKRAPEIDEALQIVGVGAQVIPRDAFHDTREAEAANGSLRVPGDIGPEVFDDITKALQAVEDWCAYMRRVLNRARGA